ncbi:MAG: CinA family nicotinamide mononucleotide deamidase-related protein [Bacteroidales bacterium]
MKAEIITIGDELLIGQTVDTNSAWIGAEMSRIGFEMRQITSISDKEQDILNTLGMVCGRADVVLITGGLGPTSDDITKNTLCRYFDTELVRNETVLGMIKEMLSRRGFTLNDNNIRQADVPGSCRVLLNNTGTAPGMWFEKGGTIFISMPGVPFEMRHIMTERVLPLLREKFKSQVVIHRNILTYGTFEAMLAETLEGFESGLPEAIRLAYLPSYGIIKLRLTAIGKNRDELETLVEAQVVKLREIIPELIISEVDEPMESIVFKMLSERGETLSLAESCTGGRIASLVTSIPGSSKIFLGSVVSYDNSIKTGVLGVDPSIIEQHGAVSRETVISMAEKVRLLFRTDWAIATSGIAGPDGGTPGKPVGTVWVSVSSASGTIAETYVYGQDRQVNISRFSVAALNLLRKQIIAARDNN